MKKMLKKSASVILSLILIFCTVPLGTLTTNALESLGEVVEGTYGSCKWVMDGNTLTISGDGPIPGGVPPWWNLSLGVTEEVIIEEGITAIGSNAFYARPTITKVTIPSTVERIDDYAFCGTGISYIDLPDSLTYIGYYAFGATDLVTINIPQGVSYIQERAFSGCDSLTYVEIPESVTEIKDYAFNECTNLLRVEMLGTLSNIGPCAFEHCSNLENIYIGGVEGTILSSFEDCVNLKNIYYGNSLEHWNNIDISDNNDPLYNATLHTNATEIPVNVTSIEMFSNPKTEYKQGLVKLDYSDGIIKVFYDDSTVKLVDITPDMIDEKIDKLFYGYEDIEVFYGGKQTYYQIYVDGKAHSHNTASWDNGYCSICGRRNDIFKEKISVEPTLYHGGEYIYGTYSITYENARSLEVLLTLGYFEPYSDDDIMYIYDKEYNLVGYYTIEEVQNELIAVEGDTIRLKLISKNADSQYNALVYAHYGFNDGDINGDYIVNAEDITMYRKYFTGISEIDAYQFYNSDINIDGKCDLKDFVALKKILAGIN